MLTEIKRWDEYIKGIRVGIVKWKSENMREVWNYYIYIEKGNLEEYDFDKLVLKEPKKFEYFDRYYFDYEKLDSYFDMHGGITYYKIMRNEICDIIGIKVGCDYNHYDDQYKYYDYNDIRRDAERSVDCFIEHFPNYLLRCHGNRKYYKPEAGRIDVDKDGKFFSFEYLLENKVGVKN